MGDLFDQVRQVVNKTKCGIIFLHHLNRKGTILGSVQIWNKPDNVLELQDGGLVFYKIRGETPHITDKKEVKDAKGQKRKLPFYGLERDKGTLLFERDSETRIQELFRQNKTKSEICHIIEKEYRLTTDAARKRVDRSPRLKANRM
jgi:hypothetical protein